MEKIRSYSLIDQLHELSQKIKKEEIEKAMSGLEELLIRHGAPKESIDKTVYVLLKNAVPNIKQQAQRTWIEEEIAKRTKPFIKNLKNEI